MSETEPKLAVDLRSELAVSPAALWDAVSTMEGVNAELAPWVRMSAPSATRGMKLADAPVGVPLFHSWLLALGVLPFDRHHLCLEQVWCEPKADRWGFYEHSSSWLQRVWLHERTIGAQGGGAWIRDRVWVQPRCTPLWPFVRVIVKTLFSHRHRQLLRRYTGADARRQVDARTDAPTGTG